MIIVDKNNYEEYLSDNEINRRWQKRDFVLEVEKYMDSSLNKVLLISGLKCTGKSIGVLQAMQGRNAVYSLMEQMAHTSVEDLMQILASREEDIIVVDEYDLVQDRRDIVLAEFFYRLISHGKQVIVIGSKPLCLEALKIGPLAHRTVTLHTTYVSFSEYYRLYDKPMNLNTCGEYLMHNFRKSTALNSNAIMNYVEEAIIPDLREFICSRVLLDETKISDIVYLLLCNIVLDWAYHDSKFLQNKDITDAPMVLEKLYIDLGHYQVSFGDIRDIADFLCRAGVLIKIPNLLSEDGNTRNRLFNGYGTFIVDPSLAYQIAMTVFPNCGIDNTLNLVYEANCVVDLYFRKQFADSIYYVELKEADSYEIGIVISSNDDLRKKQFYLFECRYQCAMDVSYENLFITSSKFDELLKVDFPDSEVCGRFIIHPGDNGWQMCESGKEIAIVNQDDNLYKYYNFDQLRNYTKQ